MFLLHWRKGMYAKSGRDRTVAKLTIEKYVITGGTPGNGTQLGTPVSPGRS